MSTVRLLERAAREAAYAFDVRPQLDGAVHQLEGDQVDMSVVRDVGRSLRERVTEIEARVASLRRLAVRIEDLADVVHLTELGWPAERERLRAALRAEPGNGVAEWMEVAVAAAAGMRVDALDRLLTDVPLTGPVEALQQRVAGATWGLRTRDLPLAAQLLGPSAAGMTFGGREVPAPAARRDACALLVRLALAAGDLARARAALDGCDDEEEDEARFLALAARVAAAAGEDETARRRWADARRADATDLDVAAEAVRLRREARDAGEGGRVDVDARLGPARTAVAARPSLADIESRLTVLVDPPVELWLATAERAADEDDVETCLLAADHVLMTSDSPETEAAAEQLRARVLEDPDERCAALTRAGDHRSAADQYRPAAACYREAMRVAGASEQLTALAALSLADVVPVMSWSLPFDEVAEDLREARRLTDSAGPHLDVAGAQSWYYLVVAALDRQLARGAQEPRRELLLEAFEATARATALRPELTERWESLADAAEQLDLHHLAYALIEKVQDGGSETEGTIAPGTAQALINMGRIREAVDGLAGAEGTWQQCARAFGQLRLGDAAAAVQSFERAGIDLGWGWAWSSYLLALLVAGRRDEAVAASRRRLAELADRSDEMTGLEAAAIGALADGVPEQLVALGLRLRAAEGDLGGEGQVAIARGHLLAGRTGEGVAAWVDAIRHAPNVLTAVDWDLVDLPALRTVATALGVALPDLQEIDAAARLRRAEFDAVDALSELRTLTESMGPAADLAADLSRALLGLTEGADRLAQVLGGPGRWEDLGPEVASLGARAAELTALDTASLLAQEVSALAATGATLTAEMRRLLEVLPDGASDLLVADGGEVPEPVLAALEQLSDDEGIGLAAQTTAALLGHPLDGAPVVEAVRLLLPASWFEGLADPVAQHELFVVGLPSLRAAVQHPVPTVMVSADEEHEPDRFTIHGTDGRVLGVGRVPTGFRYTRDDTWTLLPRAQETPRRSDVVDGWSAFADDDLAGANPAWTLLTLSPVEVVLRTLADLVAPGTPGTPGGAEVPSVPPQRTEPPVRVPEPRLSPASSGSSRRAASPGSRGSRAS